MSGGKRKVGEVFEFGLEVDEQFAHGGDDGAFVRFTAGEEALDIGSDDGVVGGCGVCGHVEAAADFGAAAEDAAFAIGLAAVAIEGSDAGEGDELIATEGGDLRQVSEDRPGGDLADALN